VEADARALIYNWDLVRANDDLKARLVKVNCDRIKDDFLTLEEVRQLKREDLVVLVNLERLRQGLSNNGNVKWDLEKIQMEQAIKALREDANIMK